MANANITHIQLVNTFNEWRAATNDLIEDRNILRNSNYVKDNGTVTLLSTVNTAPLLVVGSAGNGNVRISNALNVSTVNANTLFVNQDATITGNLTVLGNTTTLNTETLLVEDADIVVLSNVTSSPTLNAGFIVNRGSSTNTFLRWNEVNDRWGWSDDGTIMYNFVSALDAYAQANNAYLQANTARDTANDAYLQANTARNTANDAYGQANNSYAQANTARDTGNNAYSQANNAYSQANNSYAQANAAYGQANTAYGQANNAYSQANNAYETANVANTTAKNAYAKANDSISTTFGGTITGDIVITGNLTVSGSQTILNTEVLSTEDAEILLLSNVVGSPVLNSGILVNRGSSTNTFLRWNEVTDKWGWSDNGTTFYSFDTSLNAYAQANLAYTQANNAYSQANNAYSQANNAYSQANSAYTAANNIINGTTQITLKSYRDFISEDIDVSGSKTIDLSTSNWFKLTLTGSTGNRQFTFTNAPSSGTGFTVTLIILQDGSGSKTPTWANTIYWAGGQVPPATTAASARDLWTFTTYDGGSTFLGTLAVKDAK